MHLYSERKIFGHKIREKSLHRISSCNFTKKKIWSLFLGKTKRNLFRRINKLSYTTSSFAEVELGYVWTSSDRHVWLMSSGATRGDCAWSSEVAGVDRSGPKNRLGRLERSITAQNARRRNSRVPVVRGYRRNAAERPAGNTHDCLIGLFGQRRISRGSTAAEQSPQRMKIARLKTWQEKWRLWPSLSALFARRMHGLMDSVYLFRFLLSPAVSFATIQRHTIPSRPLALRPYPPSPRRFFGA